MLAQLTEAKDQMERLLARVEDVLHGVAGGSAIRRPTMASAVPARTSPLDRLNAVVASTADLREARRSGARTRRVRREDIDAHAARLILETWLRGPAH